MDKVTSGRRYHDLWTEQPPPDERSRLSALATELDEATQRRIRGLGPEPDWRCLEIGPGLGTTSRWLARLCPQGRVVAADVDMRFLSASEPNMEIVRHDVTTDEFPEESFDFICARYVFVHLRDRDRVIERVVRWLAPGGLLFLEEPARFPIESSSQAEYREITLAALDAYQRTIGTDTDWPRLFPEPIKRAGLTEIGLDVSATIVGAGRPMGRFWVPTLRLIGPEIVADGRATADAIDKVAALMDDDGFTDLGLATVATWGRRFA